MNRISRRGFFGVVAAASAPLAMPAFAAANPSVKWNKTVDIVVVGAGGAGLSDLKQATVYMRDIADAPIIREEVEKRLPAGIPMVLLKAPVCRPAWLVEIESIAINGSGGDFPPLI